MSVHAVLSKISDVVDGENMEKIKLDQSSADDSMEEDVVETKHVDFDHIFKEGNDKAEERLTGMTEEPKVLRNGSSDAMQLDNPSEKVESPQETKDRFPVLSEKRKFQGTHIFSLVLSRPLPHFLKLSLFYLLLFTCLLIAFSFTVSILY